MSKSQFEYYNIYYILDLNESPPVSRYFDSSTSQHDCLEEIRDSGKDLSLVDVEVVKVKRKISDVVKYLNSEVTAARTTALFFGGVVDSNELADFEIPAKKISHLRLVDE